ncbi:hypothetical protein KIP00_17300 [Vibrio sp. B513a]|uniref:hypothetical protein n=1 Tax=Vibrio sp. B513a TaxID=2836183 RepID=UPI0025546F06|nr:hypothetical protein [Vibrio sp. B513a]EJL6725677.1 hypothetical protein [Vibrio alginolyticus]MDK9752787.1 hypothetical protein [Vibrio sp. B513a]
MVHNRYRELIKNSTIEDLKKYITIIETRRDNNRKTKDLNERNKPQLEFLLKEYICESLNIDREILDSGNLNKEEVEVLGDFIDDIFSLSKNIKDDLDDYIGWLHEQPRAIYFFLVMIRAICENDSNHICYPVIDFSFKEAKKPSDTDIKQSKNSLKIIEDMGDLLSKTKHLNPLINICPNKTPSTYNKIVNTLEFIVTSSSSRERDRTYDLLQDLEKLYNTVYKKINTNKNVFQTSNSNLISWHYRSLTKDFPAIGLSVTESTDKQKQTILCIFDVLCATTDPNQFTKLEAKLTERFGRKERDLNKSNDTKTSKEEKTLTFSEADWAKLSKIAGSQSKSQIKAKLKELIDNELLSIEL